MKLGITGTQQGMTEEQIRFLYDFLLEAQPTEIHAGDCIGVDAQAIVIAMGVNSQIKRIGHPPIVEKKRAFCPYDEERPEKPYLDRNHDIVDETDILLAFPKSTEEELRSGTWATIRYAKKQDAEVVIVYPDGTIS